MPLITNLGVNNHPGKNIQDSHVSKNKNHQHSFEISYGKDQFQETQHQANNQSTSKTFSFYKEKHIQDNIQACQKTQYQANNQSTSKAFSFYKENHIQDNIQACQNSLISKFLVKHYL